MALSLEMEAGTLINLSTRCRIDAGENVLVGGLVLEERATVLIRGMGPSLSAFGVAQPLARARLTLFDANGQPLASNSDWRVAIPASLDPDAPPFPAYSADTAPVALLTDVMTRLGAFAPEGFCDAAIYAELPAGIYTVHLAADDGQPGVGLLEAYLVRDTVDPFTPAGRVRTAPAEGYAPALDGFAPVSAVPDGGVCSLVLDFDSPVAWLNNGVTIDPAASATIPFEATGTRNLRHGRSGAVDSRGWRVSPRYTKTDADTATVLNLATPDSSAFTLTEEVTLTFTSPGAGTFTYRWFSNDAGTAPSGGNASGTFEWTRSAPTPPDGSAPAATFFRVFPRVYSDGRPSAGWAVNASDQGRVLIHGGGPGGSDANGAREPIVTAVGGQYLLHYDGCADGGWRACRAVSFDLVNWTTEGPILELGPPGSADAGTVASPWMIESGGAWHMFYLTTPVHSGAPDYIPVLPYSTRRATAPSAFGPWTKQPIPVPFDPVPGTYTESGASPGHVLAHNGEFLQFFSAAAHNNQGTLQRALGLARTSDLAGAWSVDPAPLLPLSEQIENSSLYHEPANGLWFLFTNHVGISPTGGEFTDAIWVYWSADPTHFDTTHKAVVLDPGRCNWSEWVIGMPTVVRVGDRLAMLYDGSIESGHQHMRRDIGLAWVDLPLQPPF